MRCAAGHEPVSQSYTKLTHLYQMQCSLRTAAQSDGETALVDDLLADLEKISRKAHEQTHFTYTTLEEIAALN